jgi:putative nucleotidyltransferase with HDIG domain
MITAKDIEQLFASFLEQVKDAGLREKTVAAWVSACADGGWQTVQDVERMPFSLLADTKGIGFVEHTRTVTAGAMGLARAQLEHTRNLPYAIDMDYVIVGGLLHDVGKLVEIESNGAGGFRKSRSGACLRHPISGTVIAAKAGLPEDVLNIIACHSEEGHGRPQRVETVLVHQADFATFDPLTMKAKGTLIAAKAAT